MSEFKRLSSLSKDGSTKNGLKSILNAKDINIQPTIHRGINNASKTYFNREKKSITDEKGFPSQNNIILEKRVTKMAGARSSSRTSSAFKVKRQSQAIGASKGHNLKFKNLLAPTNDLINTLLYKNKDERYRYLIKNAKVHYIEKGTESIYVELPQIPNILIIYRKPEIRLKSKDTLNLDDRGLNHVPLLEGEERLVKLVLKRNKISKIENLVSLPYLETLDLGGNIIRELSNLNT